MQNFLAFTIVGIVTGSIYAIAACGLVVTYTTSGVFNFAHGAVGMIAAFLFWEIKYNQGWGTWPALLIVLLVFAPLFGIVVERVLMRNLSGQSTGVTLVVTVGLLVLLYGIGTTIWPGNVTRKIDRFFPTSSFRLAGVVVSYHQVIVLLVTAAVALGLRFVLYRTSAGVAMRAVVDNRELAALNGALPERVSQLAWVMGTMMAALAGVLVSPDRSMSHIFLTLLVVNGYAAAMLGRLTSLPLTFVGALGLGLGEAYLIGYGQQVTWGKGVLGNETVLSELRPVLPTVFLFVIIVLLPQARLRAGRVAGARSPRVPGTREALIGAVVFVSLAAVASTMLSDFQLFNASSGLVVALIMLSMVLLIGYAGQVSLCQYTFVGIGATVMGKWFSSGSPLGLLTAALVAAGFGAIVALPALRLRDIYLALSTVAFALFGSAILFEHPKILDVGETLTFDRLHVGGLTLDGNRAMFIFLATCFAVVALGLLAIRRGSFGRRLAAMNDSPAACATLGLNLVGTKVAVFALSAGLAGFAGALYGNLRTGVSSNDFLLLASLTAFLLAMIGGITTVTGAFIAGMALPILSVIEGNFENLNLQGLFIGSGAILISRFPNGFAGLLIDGLRRLRGDLWRAPHDVEVPSVALPSEVAA
jgi:branched-chain amino acid transport system permease protein